jgi:hypothetical protein
MALEWQHMGKKGAGDCAGTNPKALGIYLGVFADIEGPSFGSWRPND